MKYKILSSATCEGLAKHVRTALEQGWMLQGGVSSAAWSWHNPREDYEETAFEYLQAVCKPESTDRQP